MRNTAPASQLLTIEIERPAPDTALVVVRGEIDLSNAKAFTSQAEHALHRDLALLLLDLRSVTFCGCAGLSEFVRIRDLAHERGARVRVVPSGPVRRAIVATGLTDHLDGAAAADAPVTR
ncbi:STAS domain-containing protein [Amycolatopsis sp. NPDC058340]|uniref:STAS domain-containing protein n=1 Tax=Amycolatopsis sp. NPDC058340 TaxID=3346453 RepID=UPI003667EAB8